MIKVEVLEDFTLKDFSELKNIERGTNKKEEGKLFKYDKFECSKEMCEYLTGKNPLNRTVVKVIEVEPKKVEPLTDNEEPEVFVGYSQVIEEQPKSKKSNKKKK